MNLDRIGCNEAIKQCQDDRDKVFYSNKINDERVNTENITRKTFLLYMN